MKKIIETIIANERVPIVLKKIAHVDQEDLNDASQAIDDTEVTQLGIWISKKLTTNGVEATITTGGLLFFYLRATDTDNRRELFDNLLEDIGVSRPQAYRCIAVWECFGKLLIDEPQLIKYFVVEALKLLSGADATHAARYEAIYLARKGERIRIAQANQLLAKHALALDASSSPKKQAKKTAPKTAKKPKDESIWSFVGRTVRLVLKPAKSKSPVNLEAIIEDLEAALESFRQQYAETTAKQSQPVA